MTATVFDPDRKTLTTLTGGGLIATSSGAGGAMSSRVAGGLAYFEATITTLTGTPLVGIASSNWDHATALGTGANTIGYQPSGIVRNNAATIATLAAYVQGDRIGVAIDAINRLLWFRVNGGNWNNNAANDPVTGVGGIDFSGIAIASIVGAVSASLTGNVWTAKFSAAFTDTVPTGYSSLDTVNMVAIATTNEFPIPIATSLPASYGLSARDLPNNNTTKGKHFSPAGPLTTVGGVLKELNVAVGGRRVDVYDRVTGELIGTTKSAADGSWSVQCLGRPTVRIVASDPSAYNSLAYDNISPA